MINFSDKALAAVFGDVLTSIEEEGREGFRHGTGNPYSEETPSLYQAWQKGFNAQRSLH